jgi:hypothetical protein
VTLIQHSHNFLTEPHGGPDFMVRYRCFTDSGRCDNHRRLEIESEDKGNESVLASRDDHTLIANQPGVDVEPCDG